jgi:hypothetical protein
VTGLPPEAIAAAYAARYGEPVDIYTWDRVADKVLETAAPLIAVAERERLAAEIPSLIVKFDGKLTEDDLERVRAALKAAKS